MSTISTTFSADSGQLFATLNGIQARLGGVASQFGSVGASFARLAAPLAGITASIGGVVGAAMGMKHAISQASEMEQLESAFGVLVGSATVARETLEKLVAFADETIFELPELAGAAKQLIAFGVEANEVVSYLRMLGDISAGLKIPLGELADVFGRNLVQGRLFSRDIYQFQSRGIPIISALAKQFGVAESAVMGMVEGGQVGTKQMLASFRALTSEGGQFSGMLAKQAKTFGGLMSTLRDNFNALFREFGKPLLEPLKPLVEGLIERMKSLVPVARQIGEELNRVINGFVTAFKDGRLGEVVGLTLELGFAKAINFFVGAFQTALQAMGAMIANIFGDAKFWEGLAKAFLGVASQFGASLLRALETPLAYLQASIEHAFSPDGIGTGNRAHAQATEEVLANDPRFKGKTATDIRSGWGGLSRTPDQEALFQQFTAARDARAAELEKKADFVSLKQRVDRIMASGGPRYGFGEYTSKDIAQSGQALTRSGISDMRDPLRNLVGDLKLVAKEFKTGDLIDVQPLQNRFNELMVKLAPALDPTSRAIARADKGGGAVFAEPIADSLAKIGGGGNYRAFSPELSEAQKQTSVLEKVHTTLTEIKTGMTGGTFKVAPIQGEIIR